ncbi:hypothetical protein [Wenzhouxiangella limi]|nr:hypothetical protein [Wenzhouxiangella limi]
MSKTKSQMHRDRRRGIVRTALILAGIVLLIYLFFIGRTVVGYLS